VAPAVILPAPFSVQRMVPFEVVASLTVNGVVSHVSAITKPASAVGLSVIVNAFVSTAMPQLPGLVTVNVNVTTVPASEATGV
jgi:hypothetical protein